MAHVAYAAPPGGFRRGEREEEDWSDNIMLDRRVLLELRFLQVTRRALSQ